MQIRLISVEVVVRGTTGGFDEATETKRKREEKKIAINLLETTSQFNPLLLLLLTPKTSKGLVSEYFFLSNFFFSESRKLGLKLKLEKTEDIIR